MPDLLLAAKDHWLVLVLAQSSVPLQLRFGPFDDPLVPAKDMGAGCLGAAASERNRLADGVHLIEKIPRTGRLQHELLLRHSVRASFVVGGGALLKNGGGAVCGIL